MEFLTPETSLLVRFCLIVLCSLYVWILCKTLLKILKSESIGPLRKAVYLIILFCMPVIGLFILNVKFKNSSLQK